MARSREAPEMRSIPEVRANRKSPIELSARVAENFRRVLARVSAAAEKSGRDPSEVTVVAISKSFGLPEIGAAVAAGITDFGENRVQEAEQKAPEAPEGITWHMVGHVQRNKAARAARLFHTIHSLDSVRLASALNREAVPSYPVLVQVNLTANPGQGGVSPEALGKLVSFIDSETELRLEGLMTIAPFTDDRDAKRACFRRLRELLAVAGQIAPDQPMRHLSMGMTDDFEPAVEEGATMVRIGRAIFGERG